MGRNHDILQRGAKIDNTTDFACMSIVIPLDLKPIPSGYVEESTQEISVERIGSVIVGVKEISRMNHDVYHDHSSGPSVFLASLISSSVIADRSHIPRNIPSAALYKLTGVSNC